ncbi:MAG: right-handed parallel beta-helix repeat-containing protein [Pseudomonadota bacterium]
MGILSLPAAQRATDQNGAPVPGARQHIYLKSSVNYAALYKDRYLKNTRANPVMADGTGNFPDRYLIDGSYKVVTEAPDGAVLFEQDNVAVAAPVGGTTVATSSGRTFYDSAALFADTTLVYTGDEANQVTAGEGLLTLARGFVYVVADANATDHDISTAGGVKLYICRGADGAYHTAMWAVQPNVDESAKLTAAVALAAGARLVVNYPGGDIISDRLIPAANTELVLEAGVVLRAIPGGTRGIQLQNENIHVWGYGATIIFDGTQVSHAVHIVQGAKHCSVRGLKVIGAGSTGDDCFYIGGNPGANEVPEDILIADCVGDGNGQARNVMSIVACNGLYVENFEAYNAGFAPGLGIDVEANRYMADGTSAVRAVFIRGARCHDNPNNGGIGVIFGSEVTLEDCSCWNNGAWGIGIGAGGENFNEGVARLGDVLGVNGFDLVDGWIDVTDGQAGNLLSDDLGIYEGMYVGRVTRNGAAWPAEITSVRYQIVEIDSTQSKIRLGLSRNSGEITALSGQGTGARSLDPWSSDLMLNVFGRKGNNDKITIIRARCWNNAQEGIEAGTSRDVVISGCDIETDNTGINVQFSSNVSVTENLIVQTPGGSGRGLLVTASGLVTDRNVIRDFTLEGFRIVGASGAACGRDQVINCGTVSNIVYRVYNCATGFFSPILTADKNHNPATGLVLEPSCINCVASGVIAEGVGSSNSTSLVGGVNTVWRDCIQFDGSFR